MENRLSYILVGLFVFVLLIAGVFSIVWLIIQIKAILNSIKSPPKSLFQGSMTKRLSNFEGYKWVKSEASRLTLKMLRKF